MFAGDGGFPVERRGMQNEPETVKTTNTEQSASFVFPNGVPSSTSPLLMMLTGNHHQKQQQQQQSPTAMWSLYSPTMHRMPSIFEDADSTISSSFFDFPYDQGRTDHFESSSPKTDSTGRKKKDFSTKTVMDNQQHQISSTNLEMIPNNSGNMQAAFVSGLADSSASAVQFMPLGAIAPQGSTTQSMQPVHPMQLAQPIGFMQPAPPLTGKNLPPILQKNYRLRTQGNSLKPRPAVVDNEESASTPAASSPLSTTSSSMMAVDAFRSTSSSAGSPYSITEMPKRDAHIASEQRRRAVMKDAYDRLQELLPTSEYRKPSKANLLSAAVNYIMSLQRKITVVGQQNERLRLENHMLMMQIGGQGAANGPSTESQGRIAPALIQPNMVPQHPQ